MPQTLQHWIERRVESFVRRQRRKPNAVRILAEGDSWFTHGGMMWFGKSLIDKLNDYRTVNIVSLAQPGAELRHVAAADNRQWLLATNPQWLNGQTYDVVMISGGGNDIVGDELQHYLRDRADDGSGGVDLIDRTALQTTLDRMADNFRALRATVDQLLPGRPILVHGYDYAIPSGDAFELLGGLVTVGPWIKSEMIRKGITDLAEQQAIVNFLIDRFNELLQTLSAQLQDFHYLDLRGTLAAHDWADELHPDAGGRDKLAAIFRREAVALV